LHDIGVKDHMKVISLSLLICLGTIITHAQTSTKKNMKEIEVATLGSGCFWCTEAFFLRVKGIESVISGYSGGKVKNPTYREEPLALRGMLRLSR
jgi:peptide-methionine (S)-S-oxide reductase